MVLKGNFGIGFLGLTAILLVTECVYLGHCYLSPPVIPSIKWSGFKDQKLL